MPYDTNNIGSFENKIPDFKLLLQIRALRIRNRIFTENAKCECEKCISVLVKYQFVGSLF
jgi:hypothetical protein